MKTLLKIIKYYFILNLILLDIALIIIFTLKQDPVALPIFLLCSIVIYLLLRKRHTNIVAPPKKIFFRRLRNFILLISFISLVAIGAKQLQKLSEPIIVEELNLQNSNPIELIIGKEFSFNIVATPLKIYYYNQNKIFECIVDDPEIADINIVSKNKIDNMVELKIQVISKKIGTTTAYIKSKNNEIQTNKISITVIEQPEITKPPTATPKPTPKPQTDTSVYVTPTGKRYHYSKSCAGKNATSSTLSRAINRGLTPCKKCAN